MSQSNRLPRIFGLSICGLALAIATALPFAAQRQQPFDEQRFLTEMTTRLELSQDQVARLREILSSHHDQFERIRLQATTSSGDAGEVRAAIDRERRAVINEITPMLRPEQMSLLRAMGTGTQQPGRPPASAIAPLKQQLPEGVFAAHEHAIPLPVAAPVIPQGRGRRASTSQSTLSPGLPAGLNDDQRILQLLNRAGFGPLPGDIERVRKMGIERYLDQQLHPENQSEEILSKPILALNTLQMSIPETIQTFNPTRKPTPTPTPTPTPAPNPDKNPDKNMAAAPDASKEMAPGDSAATKPVQPAPKPQNPPARDPQQPLKELQQAKLLRAVFSDKQLLEVMTDFWFNHFNVFAGKDVDRYLLPTFERDVIRPHALGKFKDLLLATAQSPAMLYYLDNFLSQAPAPAPKSTPAPNSATPSPQPTPARRPGLNENYGRELMELHTLGVDGGYSQQDVIDVARCFTGWTLAQQPDMLFVFRPRIHDRGEKTVLGVRIPAGGGIEDGLRVLDILANHPSTARFVSRKLCQRFVADEPPAALVERTAAVFTKTGGDIREVVASILTSPEFNSPVYYRNKVKSPLELVASAVRATGATTDAAQPLVQWVGRLGEPLYLQIAPTGYSEESARWINTGALIERLNFAVALSQNKINGTRIDPTLFAGGEGLDRAEAIDRLLAVMIHSEVSSETKATLKRAANGSAGQITPASFDDRGFQQTILRDLTALIIGSREFQVK